MSRPLDKAGWQALADTLTARLETRAYIDDRFVDAASGETFETINPATGEVLARVASCDQADADLAVAHARRAFDGGEWSRLAPTRRKRVLLRLAELMEAHRDELALLDTLDMGKPITSALGDMAGAIGAMRHQAESIDKLYGEVAPTGEEALALVLREPIGVVASIVPWNFPMMMTAWKIAPALAAGNSVILKPSEKSPLSALRLAALAQEAGLPRGVLQVLPGFGHTVGKALALSMDVDCLAFTGSTAVGKQLMQYAGQSNLKRVYLECGGKSPNLVFADCKDLALVARHAAEAIFHNQGEVCIAVRGCWSRTACARPLSRICWRRPSRCSRGIRWTRRASWGRLSMRPSIVASSTSFARGRKKADGCVPEARRSTDRGCLSSRRCSTVSPRT